MNEQNQDKNNLKEEIINYYTEQYNKHLVNFLALVKDLTGIEVDPTDDWDEKLTKSCCYLCEAADLTEVESSKIADEPSYRVPVIVNGEPSGMVSVIDYNSVRLMKAAQLYNDPKNGGRLDPTSRKFEKIDHISMKLNGELLRMKISLLVLAEYNLELIAKHYVNCRAIIAREIIYLITLLQSTAFGAALDATEKQRWRWKRLEAIHNMIWSIKRYIRIVWIQWR